VLPVAEVVEYFLDAAQTVEMSTEKTSIKIILQVWFQSTLEAADICTWRLKCGFFDLFFEPMPNKLASNIA
jgi:hypothetical protein